MEQIWRVRKVYFPFGCKPWEANSAGNAAVWLRIAVGWAISHSRKDVSEDQWTEERSWSVLRDICTQGMGRGERPPQM